MTRAGKKTAVNEAYDDPEQRAAALRDELAEVNRQLAAERAERKRVENALKESEFRYRNLFEKAPIGIFRTTSKGEAQFVNPYMADMVGAASPEDAVARFKDLSRQLYADPRRREAFVKALVENGEVSDFEYQAIRLNGADRWFSMNARIAERLDDGGFVIEGFTIDITKGKRYEADLRRQKELLETILDNLPLMVAFMDENGTHQWVNRTWETTLGWSRDEARHIDVLSALYPDPADRKAALAYILGAEGKWRDFRSRTRGGDVIDTAWTNVSLSDGMKIGIGQDVTEIRREEKGRKDLEERFLQAQKMEAVGRLAGGVAHDFNNLLSIILGYSEMAATDMAADHPSQTMLGDIHQAALRAKALTRQLLAFARKQTFETKSLEINALVAGFEKLLRRVIGEDIELVLRLRPDAGRVRGDISQLEQVLMNLAVNARDAMDDGGTLTIETCRVELDAGYASGRLGATPGPHAMIAVSDTGEGIDPADLDNIFDPFFTTKGRDKGTGLGLSTVYGIVKQHGGNIWVYSEPGSGATFKIYLPCDETETNPDQRPVEATRSKGGSQTILVAEDDPPIRKLTCQILRSRGYRVLEATDVDAAVRMAAERRDPIHLLLTDVVMPGMKGPELYQAIVARHPETRVVYMSGYTDDVIAYQGVLEPDVHFVQKPFSVRDLAAAVAAALAGE